MKNLLVLLLFCSANLTAQISYETSYVTPNPGFNSGLVLLSTSGYKYLIRDSNDVTLYNLNHTVYRTFTIPSLPTTANLLLVRYISEDLFDTNPTDLEYMVTYTDTIGPSIGNTHVVIFDETGTMLFNRDTATTNSTVFSPSLPYQGILATDSGVKMILNHQNTLEVYALPGILPCQECTGGVISGIVPPSGSGSSERQPGNPYPNPTNGQTTIPYQLPAGVTNGTMVIFDVLGNEVKRYSITNTFSSIVLDVGELAIGTYTYSIQTAHGNIPGQQIVVTEQ